MPGVPVTLSSLSIKLLRGNSGRAGIRLPKASGIAVDGHGEGERDLAQIAQALDALGFGFGLRKRGKEKAGEDCDNSDNDKQFDESKTAPANWSLGFHAIPKGT
jgi:hypothetical protein